MRFYMYNHQNKGLALINALKDAGHIWTAQAGTADCIFTDSDVPARNKTLASFHQRQKKIFIYPHAARPNLFNDFDGYPPSQYIDCDFVPAAGHITILQAIGLKHLFEVIGWYLCPIKPFQPRERAYKVLFAPIHPNHALTLSKADQDVNIAAWKKLLPLADKGAIKLKVRYLRGLERNGIWQQNNIEYIEGQPDQTYSQIDEADLVVSHQTFAHIAIARGVPTVMMGESVPPRIGCEEHRDFKYVKNWAQYKDLLMYPLDILDPDEEDTLALFDRAIRSDEQIAAWKARLIGQPFDPHHFARTVEKYL
jgi:hypothetical protein